MAELLEPNVIMFTAFEPKVANRFIMTIDGIPSFVIKASGRPQITFGQVELHHININRKLKGKGNWEDITVTLYDPIVPSAAQAVMEWVRLSHESVTGRDGYADFYKKNLTFNALGPVGDKIEEWSLKGAWIKTANFSGFDWASGEDAAMIELTIAYDYAVLHF